MVQSAALSSSATSSKSLLKVGMVAGPIFILVSMAQALTRDGFDLTRPS